MMSPHSSSGPLFVVIGTLLALPIAFTCQFALHQAELVSMPSFHSEVSAEAALLSPISPNKAEAIHTFKLAQV